MQIFFILYGKIDHTYVKKRIVDKQYNDRNNHIGICYTRSNLCVQNIWNTT